MPKQVSPSWDLSTILDALSQPPFEPLDCVDLKMLSLKTALLLVLASGKRVSDIHAFSVYPECLQFAIGNSQVVLQPNPVFVPKNPNVVCRLLNLAAFNPPQERVTHIVPSTCFTHLCGQNTWV